MHLSPTITVEDHDRAEAELTVVLQPTIDLMRTIPSQLSSKEDNDRSKIETDHKAEALGSPTCVDSKKAIHLYGGQQKSLTV